MTAVVTPSALVAARALIERRLGLRLAVHQEAGLSAALQDLIAKRPRIGPEHAFDRLSVDSVDGVDWQRVVTRVTVGETSFFRHREWFEAIETSVLLPLVATRRAQGRRSAALWSVGCATGEEPYTLAMILRRILPDVADWNLLIQASDVNAAALAYAGQGIYRDWSMREIDATTRDTHFTRRRDKTFQLHANIREMVRFEFMNLADFASATGSPSGFDLILCRNVLMYFPPETQRRIAVRLMEALAPGGWIATSPAEASAELFRPLRAVNVPDAILFRRDDGGYAVRSPAVEAPPTRPALAEAPLPQAVISDDRKPRPIDRARRLADEGRHHEARMLCEAILAADPLSDEGYALLAVVHAEAGELDAAIQAARQCLYLRPTCPDIAFLQANLLMRAGKRESGARLMRRVLRELEAVPDLEVVRPTDGMTARAMRELVRRSLADTAFGENESDDESATSQV